MKRLHRILLVIPAALVLAACSSVWRSDVPKKVLVVPDCKSAEEQFGYAKTYETSQLILPNDDERRTAQLDGIIQCYEKVVTNFPNDQAYTPVAYLEMADCVSNKGELERAMGMYDAALSKWPEAEYVNARAMFSKARIQDRIGQHAEAKQTYASLRQRFKDSKSEKVRTIVKNAEIGYYKLQQEKKH